MKSDCSTRHNRAEQTNKRIIRTKDRTVGRFFGPENRRKSHDLYLQPRRERLATAPGLRLRRQTERYCLSAARQRGPRQDKQCLTLIAP